MSFQGSPQPERGQPQVKYLCTGFRSWNEIVLTSPPAAVVYFSKCYVVSFSALGLGESLLMRFDMLVSGKSIGAIDL